MNEVRALSELNGVQGVVKLHSAFKEGDRVVLVMDYALHGDFSTWIQRNRKSKGVDREIILNFRLKIKLRRQVKFQRLDRDNLERPPCAQLRSPRPKTIQFAFE